MLQALCGWKARDFYSPPASNGLNDDIPERPGLRILLVVANRLGCVKHALLMVDAIRSRGLKLFAVVLNQIAPNMTPQEIADRPNKHNCPREFSKGGDLQISKAMLITTPMLNLLLERVHNLVAERDALEFSGSQ
jgi:hypothetical protein